MALFRQAPGPLVPDDLVVLDNGAVFADGEDRLEYLWFHLLEREGGEAYEVWRVVALRLLRYLPQEARQLPGLVERMRTVLTGLYNQRVATYDLAELKAAIFDPPLGVLQMYGAVGMGEDRDAARRNALLGMAAVQGAMANFEQSRLEPLTVQVAEWMRRALSGFPHALVVIGQPEERPGPRGMGREGPGEMGGSVEGPGMAPQQQAEMMCRAMAAAEEEFVAVTLASRVLPADLARMLAGVAQEASVPASQVTGVESISAGIALPVTLSESLARSAGAAFGRQVGEAVTEGTGISKVASHVKGRATTVGRAVTDGTAHTEGFASTRGGSTSTSVTRTEGEAHTEGTAHTEGRATTVGSFSSATAGGFSSVSHGASMGVALTSGHADSVAGSASHAEQGGYADSQSASRQQGVDVGASAILRAGYRDGITQSFGRTEQHGTVDTVGQSHGATDSAGRSVSAGGSVTQAAGSSWSRSSGSSRATTRSTADTSSQADTASRSVSRTTARSSFQSSTQSVADTVSHAETRSWASSESEADGIAHGVTRSRAASTSRGTAVGRNLSLSRGSGFGVAAVPSFALSRSYQWWNDAAAQLTQILRAQEELLRQATLEGAYLTDVYVLARTEFGAATAEVGVRQAFQGSGPLVVTPVQTRRLDDEEQRYVRHHAACFTPSTREEPVAGALEAYRDATLLLPRQLAAYTAPVLFEEGLSITTQERIPQFAFVPDMPGDVVLGHQWSTERARLTSAPLRLSRERFSHTVFAADTGFGKTVAAERMVVETTRKWHLRTVVLDFGAGWRRLMNASLGDPGRVEVRQLFPGAPVPFRWNPWQVGRRIRPERQLLATCELFKNAGRMGARQLGLMRRAARELYLEQGVLVSDREVLADPAWNRVRPGEEEAIGAARRERGLAEESRAGVHLEDLEPEERQALAVHRSKGVDLSGWVERLASYRSEFRRDQATLQSLEGVLLRLEVFTQGEMARMYGGGEGAVAVEDLGLLGAADDPWGVSILEGGAELDEYAKAALLGLVAWHLYNDAVVRRRQNIGKKAGPALQIVFEEANKVLTGIETDGTEGKSGAATTTEQYLVMWRDGRKYHIFLHPVVQTVSDLPPGILSSCNIGFFGQTKNPRDRDLIMAHLAFSEKGFTDEDYKRFLSRMPAAVAVVKLGYSMDLAHTTPFLVRPAMVVAEEPTDEEVLARQLAMRAARKGR